MPASQPTNNLFILSGIQPTELCHQKAILSLACLAQEPEHFLYKRILSPLGEQLQQLKSRHIVPAVSELLNNLTQSGINVAQWDKYKEHGVASRLHTVVSIELRTT